MSRLTADLNFTSGHERTLLAAAMNGGNGDLVVTANDFFSPQHRKIFNAVASLPCSERNLLAVQDELIKRGQLQEIGGRAGLTEIACETVSSEIVRYAQDQVLDASRQRDAMHIFKDAAAGKITIDETRKRLDEIFSARTGTLGTNWLATIDAGMVRSSELASLVLTKRQMLLAHFSVKVITESFSPRAVWVRHGSHLGSEKQSLWADVSANGKRPLRPRCFISMAKCRPI